MWHPDGGAPDTPWRSRPPLSRAAVARLVQLAGLFDAITAILPPSHGRMATLAELVPPAGMLSARAATGVAGLLLVYLGPGLRRGKHRAWQVAAALAVPGVLLHLFKGLDVDAAAVSAGLLVVLIVARGRFQAAADPRNRWRALRALAGFGAAGFVLGFVEIAMRAATAWSATRVWRAGRRSPLLGLIGVAGPVRFAHPIGAEAVSYTTGAFGLLACGAAAVLLLRPGTRVPRRSDEDEARLRALLDRHGDARLARLLRAAPRQARGLVAVRQGGRRLPGGRRGRAGLRRPDRRPRGLARRDRGLARRAPPSTAGRRR